MIKLISCACAIALCLAAPSPVMAKEGCGSGLHMNKKGQCVAKKKMKTAAGKVCKPGYTMGGNGHCHHN